MKVKAITSFIDKMASKEKGYTVTRAKDDIFDATEERFDEINNSEYCLNNVMSLVERIIINKTDKPVEEDNLISKKSKKKQC